MKNFVFRWALALLLVSVAGAAHAQTANRQPLFAATNAWVDAGNGPTEIMPIEGSAIAYTSGVNATGVTGTSAGTTALTLSATPAIPPCVGCAVTCALTNTAVCTIPAGTTVTAYNGTTGVTTSAATTTTAASLSWGVACPTSGPPTAPSAAGNVLSPPLNLRSGVDPFTAGIPIYSASRVCLYGGQQQGGTVVTFAIGAH